MKELVFKGSNEHVDMLIQKGRIQGIEYVANIITNLSQEEENEQ